MIIYESNKRAFRKDVRDNAIESKILDSFKIAMKQSTTKSEMNSWKNSMMYMSNVLDDKEIPEDAGILIEYMIPRSSKRRIDFIICGMNEDSQKSVVIVELKQWSSVEKTDQPGVVKTFIGKGVHETTHPSYQAWSYATYLEDFNEVIETENVKLKPCAYLHNCEHDSEIRDPFYQEDLEKAPLFIRKEAQQLTNFIKKHVRFGDKDRIMYKIDNGIIRPTKKLADAFGSMLKGKREFVMIDDQKIVYEKAVLLATKSKRSQKNVLIVKGGPGTGKSVVAVNLLVNFIKQQLNAQYVSKNAAPREVYATKLTGAMTKSRYKSLFVGSGSFVNSEKNTFDALIVDESHRLNEKSGMFSHLGENQVKEIINSSLFSVFFLDEDQKIAFQDIGSIDEIRHWANKAKANITELELSSQFRCNGSDGYLSWLDNYLQIRETENIDRKDFVYDVRVFDDPFKMHSEITKLNNSGVSSRTVAGYCWDWKSQKDAKKYDIVLGQLKMKWNLKSHGSTWIINPKSITEAGCIHTCQGLEVDYIGVIIGPDFIIRNGKVVTNAFKRSSADKTIKGFKSSYKMNPLEAQNLADLIIKNTYRTLMTRGMKGCFIYCTDKETNDYFKALIG